MGKVLAAGRTLVEHPLEQRNRIGWELETDVIPRSSRHTANEYIGRQQLENHIDISRDSPDHRHPLIGVRLIRFRPQSSDPHARRHSNANPSLPWERSEAVISLALSNLQIRKLEIMQLLQDLLAVAHLDMDGDDFRPCRHFRNFPPEHLRRHMQGNLGKPCH